MSTGLKANSDGSAAIQVGGTDVITLTSGGAATFVTSPTTLAGNLTFSGTGNRITGDFSNATVANRVMFQTSTANSVTVIGVLPSGTGNSSYISFSNSSTPDNAAYAFLGVAGTSEFRIEATKLGTGTYLPMTFYTGGTESMRLSATSKALILSGGDTTANGTGITFPATQSASTNANTLDDYEEGTWTPTLAGGFSTAPTSYSTQSGSYTKIGRFVYFQLDMDANGAVGNASQIAIGGLPFTSNSSSSLAYGAAIVSYQAGFDINAGDTFHITSNSTQILVYANAAGATRNGNSANVDITQRIILAGMYQTA